MNVPLTTVFLLAVWVGRKSILSTRINRRLTALVGISAVGTLVQRIVCALLGLEVRQTIMQNFILVAIVCITGGVTLHGGFFWSAGAVAIGFLIAALVPGYEIQLFGVSMVGALVFAVLSWRNWKGEFSLGPSRS